jgi:hypothetical protein
VKVTLPETLLWLWRGYPIDWRSSSPSAGYEAGLESMVTYQRGRVWR